MDKSEREKTLIRYILGQMPPEEKDALEDQYLADDEQLEELVSVENDLIDSYVRGNLPRSDRESFERLFLTPEKRERVDFARALLQYPKVEAAAKRQWTVWPAAMRVSALAASLAGFIAIAWLVASNIQMRRQIAWQHQEENRLQHAVDDLQAKLQERTTGSGRTQELPPLDQPGSSMISMVLTPVNRSYNQPNTVFLSPGLTSVTFFLNRPNEDYSAYAVVLETTAGTQLLRKDNLEAQPASNGKKVVVELPAKSLSSEDYVLRLFGISPSGREELAPYSFRILKMTTPFGR